MMQDQSITLRPATAADLEAINDIYNHYVLHSTCTYQEVPETVTDRQQWFKRHGERHPVIVAKVGGQVLGWGSLSVYHARSAFRHTVENSIYVHPQQHRRGVGSRLLEELIVRSRVLGHHASVAAIAADQPASLALHGKFHFEPVGRLREVGFKFGRWLDLIHMELLLNGSRPAA